MAKTRRTYPQKLRDEAVADFLSGMGYGMVAQKHDVPKSAVRSFVRSAKVNTNGRADMPGKQHKPRTAEKQIVARAKAGDKGNAIAKRFKLPFRTAIAAAWRFGNVFPDSYSPLS